MRHNYNQSYLICDLLVQQLLTLQFQSIYLTSSKIKHIDRQNITKVCTKYDYL